MTNAKSETIKQVQKNNGKCGFYDLCLDLTNQFEEINKDRQWDGEFLDEIYSFVKKNTL